MFKYSFGDTVGQKVEISTWIMSMERYSQLQATLLCLKQDEDAVLGDHHGAALGDSGVDCA
jgi:hypothetical protein